MPLWSGGLTHNASESSESPKGSTSTRGRKYGDMADQALLAQLRKVGVDSGRAQEAEARHYAIAEAGNSGKGPAGVVRSEERGPIALRNDLVHRLLEENRSLKDELEAVKSQLADAKTLVEVRGKELKAAQVFLTRADRLSTTDVVQKVNALNEEIFQAAALLGEMLRNTERTDRTQEEVTVAFEKARWMVGDHMASLLAAESVNLRTELNPLLVQVVLQIAITTWCKFVVSSWRPSDSAVADFLAAIYSEIRKVEDQAVSGRWRSITQAQLRSSSYGWTGNLMGGLLSVLVIAGWSTREPDQQNQFERSLPAIFKAVQDLRKALGEDVTSMDIEVAVIDAGDPFNPTYMEDGYWDPRASSGSGKKAPEKVSGTTGLGLHKISMKQTSKGPVTHSEMVLFPKVVLEGTVKEAMDPAPPPASRLRKKPKTGDRPGNDGGGGGGGGGAPATCGTGAGGMLQSASSFVSQAEGQAAAQAQDRAIAEAGNAREGGPDVTAPSGAARSDQMHMQQQQLPEVAQAIEPKSGSRSTMLGIGEGGSSDKPQSSKEKPPRRKIAKLEYELQPANNSTLNLDHHSRQLWNHAKTQSEELQKSQHQNHRLLDDNRSLTHELEAVKSQLADAKNLSEVLMVLAAAKTPSEVRGKELKGNTTDVDQGVNEETWEGSDILLTAAAVQMVDVLNVEVRRAVAVLGKVMQKTKFEEGPCQIMHITEKARLMLGENMVALLSAGLPEKARLDPLLVQVVLQVAITNWCKITISSWKPGNSDASNLLSELYSKIREVEDPTFYRRWRSVTWAQLKFSSSGWSQDLLDILLDILAFARWPSLDANQKNLFEEQFPLIFNAVRDLRKALGEDITSIDIEVAAIVPGMTFDSTSMDNGWTRGSTRTLEIVSGTTGLGLKKVIMKPSTEGGLVPHVDVIYRPKVILESTMKGALVPPAQKKGLPKRGAASGDGRGQSTT